MNENTILVAHKQIDFITDKLPPRFRVLRNWDDLGASDSERVEAIVVAEDIVFEKEMLAKFRNTGLIACLTSGYDGVDIAWANARGLAVSHAVNVNHEDVADHAVGLLIAWVRGLVTGNTLVRAGQWDAGRKVVTRSLRDVSVGIVGMGAIGQAIARRCTGLDLPVRWWGPRSKADISHQRSVDLISLARDSDVLIVASSANESNRNMISNDVLDALGPEGLLINVARGSLIDEEALVSCLLRGEIAGAALDVFAQEPTPPERWSELPNVILTPHCAGATRAVIPKMIDQLVLNLDAFFAGERLLTPVAA